MIERDINIEFEAEQIAIEAVICFTQESHSWGMCGFYRNGYEYNYLPEHTRIKRVVNLELNEGAPPIPTTMEHFKMLERYWEDHDVYDEI